MVESIREIETKKGDKMAFITGSDETATQEYTLFPSTYKEYGNILWITTTADRFLFSRQFFVTFL